MGWPGMASSTAISKAVTNKPSVCAARLRSSGDAAITVVFVARPYGDISVFQAAEGHIFAGLAAAAPASLRVTMDNRIR